MNYLLDQLFILQFFDAHFDTRNIGRKFNFFYEMKKHEIDEKSTILSACLHNLMFTII